MRMSVGSTKTWLMAIVIFYMVWAVWQIIDYIVILSVFVGREVDPKNRRVLVIMIVIRMLLAMIDLCFCYMPIAAERKNNPSLLRPWSIYLKVFLAIYILVLISNVFWWDKPVTWVNILGKIGLLIAAIMLTNRRYDEMLLVEPVIGVDEPRLMI